MENHRVDSKLDGRCPGLWKLRLPASANIIPMRRSWPSCNSKTTAANAVAAATADAVVNEGIKGRLKILSDGLLLWNINKHQRFLSCHQYLGKQLANIYSSSSSTSGRCIFLSSSTSSNSRIINPQCGIPASKSRLKRCARRMRARWKPLKVLFRVHHRCWWCLLL